MYNKRILKNGLTVLTVPIVTATSITMSIFIKAGSRYEPKELNGISHFLEHLHFKGTKKFPTAKKLSEIVDSIGGEFNANTGKEHTQYFIRAEYHHLPLVFNVLTDMLQNPLFPAKEIEKEKGVIVEEINMYHDNPQIHVESLFEENLWPETPLGRDIAGKPEVVRAMTRQNILDYRNKFYQPKNMIIAVAGRFEAKELDRLIQKSWGRVPNKKFGSFVAIKEKQTNPRLTVQNKVTEQAHMIVGFRGYPITSKNNYPLRILASVLGGGMSSRLFIKIREQRGLAYYVYTAINSYLDTGNFLIRAGLKVSSAPAALDVILAELNLIKRKGITRSELAKAKDYIKGKTALGMEDPHEKMEWFLGQEAFLGKIKSVEEDFKLLDQVTTEDVSRVANELIRNDRLNLALIGPFPDKKIFEKKLRL